MPVKISEIDEKVIFIIETIQSYTIHIPKDQIHDIIWSTYEFARDAHDGQFRKSLDPYVLHPVEAAIILLQLHPDIVTVQACLLHDVPEDTDRTVEEIEKLFGKEVAHITSGMEKLSKVKYKGEEREIGSLRKMFIAMSQDVRLIFVKLADRLHNMRTLEYHPDPKKRERIALETLNIYAPIADRLGIFDFKEMLETECFRILHPEDFQKIQIELDLLKTQQDLFLSKVVKTVTEVLPENVPIHNISYRVKSPYSIYKKMSRKNYEHVSDLYDLFALRIITNTISHCYEILGVIHSNWTPVPNRFKDYIALPKENRYQSLHTTVLGLLRNFRHQPTEIQIRTNTMHEQAEIGIAAHFSYSEAGKSLGSKDYYWVNELKQIIDTTANTDFYQDMKIRIFDDQIFVLTPKGDVKILPKGSTPIDFAYSIHSDLGNHLMVARVNDRVVPLDYQLKSGDRVDVVVEKSRAPSISWLSFVKTPRAKEVIKQYINREQRTELIEKGKFIFNSYLERNYGKSLDKELSLLRNLDGRILSTREKEDVLVTIGNLSRKPSSIVRNIEDPVFQNEISKARDREEKQKKNTGISSFRELPNEAQLIIGGEKNIAYKLAQCCTPKVGNRVVAYISKNGVNIHQVTCPQLKKGSIDRCIPCFWEGQEYNKITIRAELIFENKIGVMKRLTDILYQMRLNIEEMQQKKIPESNLVSIHFELQLEEEDYYIYDRLIERIKLMIPEFQSANLLELQ